MQRNRFLRPLSLVLVALVLLTSETLLVTQSEGTGPSPIGASPTASLTDPASLNASPTAAPTPVPTLLPTMGIVWHFDVIVYGGTPSGVIAATAAARAGASVALLEPSQHLGGMIASGLGRTDILLAYKSLVGGLTAKFFSETDAHYRGNRTAVGLSWYVEPHVAEEIFWEMAAGAGVTVFYNENLAADAGVVVERGRIVDAITETGEHFMGRVYIDASYQGDLMAQAGVTFTVGRESSATYGEPLAGVRPVNTTSTWMVSAVDKSGALLPGVSSQPLAAPGSGDDAVMAYSYRVCLSSDPSNQVGFAAPAGYDRARYALLQAWIDRHFSPPDLSSILVLAQLPNHKADVSGHTLFATDDPGAIRSYANASYEQRRTIAAEIYAFDAGLLYYLSHDPAVPDSIAAQMRSWGLCKDEFTDNDNGPPLLYVREARRLVGEYVMTQADVQTTTTKPDSIGLGSYRIDSHAVQIVDVNGNAYGEGIIAAATRPYQIPYRSLIPQAGQVANLIVTVDVSASHVAWSSLRMEPQFMIMGEAGGTAAALALTSGGNVRAVDVSALQKRLRTAGAILADPKHR